MATQLSLSLNDQFVRIECVRFSIRCMVLPRAQVNPCSHNVAHSQIRVLKLAASELAFSSVTDKEEEKIQTFFLKNGACCICFF